MKNHFVSLLVGVALVFVGGTGCITKTNVVTKGSSPRFVPGTTNVVYETFEHTDKSLRVVQPEWGCGGGGNIFRFRATVGGGQVPMGGQYGYGAGSYGYHVGGTYVQGLAGPQPITGWPVETRPSWMQGADWHRTQEMYRGSRIQSGGGFHY